MNAFFTANGVTQIAFYMLALTLLARPLGSYIARVYNGERVFLSFLLSPLERVFYGLAGIDASQEMPWHRYAAAVIISSIGGFVLLFAILLLQDRLPFNPQGFGALDPDLAFSTAVSFVTNTNWQSYGGETTMSYFSQMVGLTVQNFLSASMGMAVLAALVRGLVRRESKTLGNYWSDVIRGIVYILMPLSLLWALVLVSQGVVQTFDEYREVQLLEPIVTQNAETGAEEIVSTQTIAIGPAASQIAIKQLGTNGGGFFSVNSAHPLENPTALSNFLELLAILLIPAALCFAFGAMVRDMRQGWAVYAAMTVIFIPLMLAGYATEQYGNTALAAAVDQAPSDMQAGGNMEGKEARFGIANSALWMAATTAASNGSVNSMHDSYTPIGGGIAMFFIHFGEVIYGGVGSGLYGMLIFAIITVFIAGLMVGRTPEYLGKKIQAYEIKVASIAILIPCAIILLGTAVACVSELGLSGLQERGVHGFSEMLYAMTSAGANNGSAFGGLTADSYFYNTAQGLLMLFGRYWVMIPALAIAGSLAAKKTVPVSAGTLPTHTPLFVLLLASVIVLVGVLTFVPALALGPVAEWAMMR